MTQAVVGDSGLILGQAYRPEMSEWLERVAQLNLTGVGDGDDSQSKSGSEALDETQVKTVNPARPPSLKEKQR